MENSKNYLLLFLILMCSCSPKRSFINGSFGSLKSYTEKPFYNGKKTASEYVSLGISEGKEAQYKLPSDTKKAINIKYHKVYTSKNINFYYGGGMTYGRYKFNSEFENIIFKNDKKDFYNINLKSGFDLKLSTKRIEFRLLGIEATFNNDFGSYQKFLNTYEDTYPDNIINNQAMFSMNIYGDYAFKINSNNYITFGGFQGRVFNNTKNRRLKYIGAYLAYTYKKYTINFITQETNRNNTTSAFSFTYKL